MLKWVGLVLEVDKNNEDALAKFLNPDLPNTFFHHPSRDDYCWVSKSYILIMLKTLSSSTISCKYQINTDDLVNSLN